MFLHSIKIVVAILFLSCLSFLWNPVPLGHNWLLHHLDWTALFAQALFCFTGAIFSYDASFRKETGGIIGVSLKIFAIGLLLLGIGLFETPIVQIFRLWQTWYISSGLLYIIYFLAGICLIASLLVVAKAYSKKALILFEQICLFSLLLRTVFFLIPFQQNTFYMSFGNYQWGVTMDTLFLLIELSVLMLSFLLRSYFAKSTIGNIFTLQTIGMSWFLIPTIMSLAEDFIPRFVNWYRFSGIWVFDIAMLGGTMSFFYFGYYLKNMKFVK